jgi:MFS family permease
MSVPIVVPIVREFDVPLTAVAVFAVTLWLRLPGATAAGWMAGRMGRRAPLMISILVTGVTQCGTAAPGDPTDPVGSGNSHASPCAGRV